LSVFFFLSDECFFPSFDEDLLLELVFDPSFDFDFDFDDLCFPSFEALLFSFRLAMMSMYN